MRHGEAWQESPAGGHARGPISKAGARSVFNVRRNGRASGRRRATIGCHPPDASRWGRSAAVAPAPAGGETRGGARAYICAEVAEPICLLDGEEDDDPGECDRASDAPGGVALPDPAEASDSRE